MEFKISLSFFGKIIGYVFDFFTYRKRFNVKIDIDSTSICNNNGTYTFDMSIINTTSYEVRIKNIKTSSGDLKMSNIVTIDREPVIKYLDINKSLLNIVLNGYDINNESNNKIVKSFSFSGNKIAKINLEYQILTIKSNFLNRNIRNTSVYFDFGG